MKKPFSFAALSLLLIIFLLAACQPEATAAPATEIIIAADTLAPTLKASATPVKKVTQTAKKTPTAKPSPSRSPSPTVTATPYKVGPYYPKNVNPLTGLEVSDPEILDRRPLMIKVSNFPAYGRPQSGLSFADIVFETYIGEGTNRFSAIFYGQNPEKVGPVRSARLADPQLASMYQSVLAFQSADARVYVKILQDLSFRAISGDASTCPALCNMDPNSIIGVFAEPEKLTEYAEAHGVYPARKPLDGMVFSSALPDDSGEPAGIVTVRYNDLDIGEWRYNVESGAYLRWVENVSQDNVVTMVPLEDKLTGEQLAFNNVLILFAHYNEYNPTLHNIEILSNRNGMRAVLFRDGFAYTGYWISPAVEQPMQFYFLNGKPLTLKPGNSWMVITGSDSELAVTNPGSWLMQFLLP
ncbi:MAG: DUF3048 domain-containing protein [Anaerolineaceae bacterium]